ncbi:MAG: 4-hydroxy-tetrahydrodipicolinate synthase [Marivirga sp.]|jgi:4-hydroxy-tetrahydrodipicolinate synthase
MSKLFKGVGPALITPFKKDYSIDFEGLERLLVHTAQGADYYVVQGTTGESATTTLEEKRAILDFILSHNPKQLPVVFGVGGNNTLAVVSFLKDFNFEGVEAILSASPHYNKPSQEGIYRHYVAIADASPKPVILYNVPGRTASNIAAETSLRLAEHKNIIGIKEASGNLEQCMHIAANKPADFMLISGDDLMTNSLISLGAVGVISVLANPFPQVFAQMVRPALENNFKASNEALFKLLQVNALMYEESNPVGAKEALKQLGVCEHYVRMPLLPASDALANKIKNLIISLNLN